MLLETHVIARQSLDHDSNCKCAPSFFFFFSFGRMRSLYPFLARRPVYFVRVSRPIFTEMGGNKQNKTRLGISRYVVALFKKII